MHSEFKIIFEFISQTVEKSAIKEYNIYTDYTLVHGLRMVYTVLNDSILNGYINMFITPSILSPGSQA